ncbi:bifunctional 3'-5' exonuclease/ATP-dependent helicase WRN-like [Saccostrea cucullata]|uniref:bifunctional 3'-5' exonuclease/ATP-dependent helicase WRN-like n=1 Tax=Saccostrea cuccullata TaxID=36930 RepID=UPI002ED22ABB
MPGKSSCIAVLSRSVTASATLYNHVKDCLLERNKSIEIIDMFHRSIDEKSSLRVFETFKMQESNLRCLFATVAFGMGIQIKDIQIVVHWGLPKSVMSYWQEVGRADRDGRQSYAICYAYGRSMIKKNTDESIINIAKSSLQKERCVRYGILKHMSIVGMRDMPLSENGRDCDGSGELCPAVKCCSFCSSRCKCNTSTIEIEEELGI